MKGVFRPLSYPILFTLNIPYQVTEYGEFVKVKDLNEGLRKFFQDNIHDLWYFMPELSGRELTPEVVEKTLKKVISEEKLKDYSRA